MRPAIARRSSSNHDQAMDEIDSPVEGFENGTLAIKTTFTTRGPITDVWQRPARRPLPDDENIILRFEIPYARVLPPVSENKNNSIKKYVVYDVSVRQDSSTADANPATMERRYTHFLSLYENLKRSHPIAMQNFVFPKKVMLGNFSADLIAERSALFEVFLDGIVTVAELRDSQYFLEFVQGEELAKSCQLLDERRNEQAVPILENCFRLLNKVYLDRSKCVLLLLCRLVAACTTSPVPHPLAEKYAELALRRYEGVCDTELLSLYIPLLQTCSHLWWQRGRNNKLIEDRLKDMTVRGMKVKNGPNLSQAINALEPRVEAS